MRLIDAEPIKNFIVGGLNNPDRKNAFGYDAIQILAEIEFAPTVDAIPVSWLKEKLKGHPELTYATTDGLNAVLRLWGERGTNETD